jgi:hypothetical protein
VEEAEGEQEELRWGTCYEAGSAIASLTSMATDALARALIQATGAAPKRLPLPPLTNAIVLQALTSTATSTPTSTSAESASCPSGSQQELKGKPRLLRTSSLTWQRVKREEVEYEGEDALRLLSDEIQQALGDKLLARCCLHAPILAALPGLTRINATCTLVSIACCCNSSHTLPA